MFMLYDLVCDDLKNNNEEVLNDINIDTKMAN
jgi:hypothetical protein